MDLKIHPIKIDKASPFDKDLLARREEIENLTLLALNVNSPAVLSIDSQWGTGKTTFIKLWEQYLKSQGKASLYFNAWETDFSDDPLVSFLGEMNEGLKSLIGDSERSTKAWSKTKTAGKQIAKRGIPAIIKIATAGVIDTDKIIEEELAKVMGALAGDALDDYLKQKSSIAEFHTALSDFINSSRNDYPVVFFIDELDRCRPTYAIALLERIKHLFNIEGLVFVLALDKAQLGHSIRAVYGNKFDSNGYLQRFIDFEYQLKRPDIKNYIESLMSTLLLKDLFAQRMKYKNLQYDEGQLVNAFHMLATSLQLTLREIEQTLASINLAIRTAKESEFIHPALMVFLVVSKNKNKKAYQRYISESSNETELIRYLHRLLHGNYHTNFQCAQVEGLLIAAKKSHFDNYESKHLSEHKKIIEDNEIDSTIKEYSKNVILVAEHPIGSSRHIVDLTALAKRIDLISSLKLSGNESQEG